MDIRIQASRGGRVTALFAALALGGGCMGTELELEPDPVIEPDPNNPCVPGPSPSLTLGQGDLSYTALGELDTLELVHGPQGGVHTTMALQASDINASEMLVGELRGYLNGQQVGASYPYLEFRCAEGKGQQVWGLRLIWDAQPEELHLQTIHIEAELTDAEGVVVSTSKDAIIHDSTLD